jgi:3-hydroxyacyl-[acyl-carrier-protein] dehydratase
MNGTHDIVEPVRIPPDHPALPGHFPGRPIVPGVVLLDCIAAALERTGDRLTHIGVVKFLAPLGPDEHAELRISRSGRHIRFQVDRAGAPILRGEGELA